MRVLAVDPGYDRLGIAVMEHDSGSERLIYSTCITTDKHHGGSKRLATIGTAFVSLLEKYQPDAVGIEKIFFNKNQTTVMGVAEVRGVILYLAEASQCAVHEFGPQEIKVAVTGYGKSDKKAVIDMVLRLVSDAPKKALDDEYDAIATAITTLAHRRKH